MPPPLRHYFIDAAADAIAITPLLIDYAAVHAMPHYSLPLTLLIASDALRH